MSGVKGKTGIYPKEKRKGLFQKGHTGFWKGKKRLGTIRIKRSKEFVESRIGNKNPNWLGGKSFEDYSFDWTETLRESIRIRDKFICKECGVHQNELETKIDVHHIDYNKKNCNPDNLISLCRKCHIKTNYNRNYWINRYKIGSQSD